MHHFTVANAKQFKNVQHPTGCTQPKLYAHRTVGTLQRLKNSVASVGSLWGQGPGT